MILRNLLRRRTRSLLTVVGIAIGVAAVVALGAIVEGFVGQFTAVGQRSGADLVAMQAKVADMTFSAIDEDLGRRVATMPQVKEVAGIIFTVVPMEGNPYFIIWGLDPAQFGLRHYRITEGEGLRPGRSKEIILGKTSARYLKKGVGDVVKIYDSAYRIVGLYETGVAFEDGGGVITLKEAQALMKKPRQVSMYGVKLRDLAQADAVLREIEQRFPQISISRTTDFAENTQDIQVSRAMAWGISFIAVLVGGVGMMNTMLMSVFERTREIGVLRALGWRRRRVLTMILQESLLLSTIGGAAGIALGMALTKLVQMTALGQSMLTPNYQPGLFVQALLVAFFLGAIGGLYPAWRASQLSPVEALRYE
jgi:putative ABC transport system permease protein